MNRTVRWTVTTALMCSQSLALAGDPVIDRVRACATESDDAKRLACYDFQIERAKTGQNDDLGVTGELLRQKQRQAGLPAARLQEMTCKVVAIRKPPYAEFVVTLDNGQVWAQAELLDFSLKAGDVITIRRGLLGVLWMVDASHPRTETRVKRIR